MTLIEYEAYIQTIDDVEERITDDNKFPVIKDNKIKRCCKHTLEVTKIVLNFLKYKIDAEKEKQFYETTNP